MRAVLLGALGFVAAAGAFYLAWHADNEAWLHRSMGGQG